jgi:hypothetical protein
VSEKSPSGNQTWLEDHPMIADFPIKTAKITDPFPMKKPPLPQDFPQSDARFVPGEAKKNGVRNGPERSTWEWCSVQRHRSPSPAEIQVCRSKGLLFFVGESPKWIKMDGLSYGASIIYIYNYIYNVYIYNIIYIYI